MLQLLTDLYFTCKSKIKAILIQQKIYDTHNDNTLLIAPYFYSVFHHDDFFKGIINTNQ